MGAQARTKLELPKDMHKYLNEKFKIFVNDKAIQESVLDLNPVPDAESLNTPKVDGYLRRDLRDPWQIIRPQKRRNVVKNSSSY